jgi:hypothetical protein
VRTAGGRRLAGPRLGKATAIQLPIDMEARRWPRQLQADLRRELKDSASFSIVNEALMSRLSEFKSTAKSAGQSSSLGAGARS